MISMAIQHLMLSRSFVLWPHCITECFPMFEAKAGFQQSLPTSPHRLSMPKPWNVRCSACDH